MPRNEERASLRKIWGGMRKRCYDHDSKDYRNYGAKGITICAEWKDDFEAFYEWSMAHGYRKGLSIDRICNSRGYSPGNCRWISKQAQALNRRTNTMLEAHGKIMTMSQWSKLNGIRTDTIVRRLEAGWSVEDAVTRPVQVQHHHKRKRYGLQRSGQIQLRARAGEEDEQHQVGGGPAGEGQDDTRMDDRLRRCHHRGHRSVRREWSLWKESGRGRLRHMVRDHRGVGRAGRDVRRREGEALGTAGHHRVMHEGVHQRALQQGLRSRRGARWRTG